VRVAVALQTDGARHFDTLGKPLADRMPSL
jgi:hypothetical protein